MAPAFVSKVDLNSEVDVFMDLVAYAMKVLVAGILDRIEPALRTMAATNWSGDSQVCCRSGICYLSVADECYQTRYVKIP